jgi:hypothetical protein
MGSYHSRDYDLRRMRIVVPARAAYVDRIERADDVVVTSGGI